MIASFLFLLGLSIGSFINCLVYRLNYDLTLKGRSFCPQCKHQLSWYDNVPLLSFILLKGHCRYCGKKISIHYPLVEIGTGILTVLIFFYSFDKYLIPNTLYLMLIGWALMAIFLSDLLYFTIPDEVVYSAIIISIIRLILTTHYSLLLSGLGAALFFLLLVLITKGRGMGMGDVKLGALMGLFLGYPGIVIALYLAFLTGALIGVTLILLGKKRLNAHIPFGPFLVGSTITILFYGEQIKSFIFSILHF